MEINKGLPVNVFRTNYDCTANGISSNQNRLILIGENIVELFEANKDNSNVVKLIKRKIGEKEYLHCEPISKRPESCNGPMFGGNFIYTSDSRFPNDYPIAIHDRYEKQI